MEREEGLRNHVKIYLLSREILFGAFFFFFLFSFLFFFPPRCNHSHCTNSTDFLRNHVRNQMAISSATGLTLVFNNICFFIMQLVVLYIYSSETLICLQLFKKYTLYHVSKVHQSNQNSFKFSCLQSCKRIICTVSTFPDKFLSNMGTMLNWILLCK